LFFQNFRGGDLVSTGNQNVSDACRRCCPLRYQAAAKINCKLQLRISSI